MKRKVLAALMPVIILSVICGGCSLFQGQDEVKPLIRNTYVYDAGQDDYLVGLSKKCMKSIVEIRTTFSDEADCFSSGVIIDASNVNGKGRTYIITNNHVVSGDSGIKTPTSMTVWQSGEQVVNSGEKDCKVLTKTGADKTSDLAIISIPHKAAHTAAVYSADELTYGQRILAIGSGLKYYGTSVCDGLVSNWSVTINTDKFKGEVIQISAPVNSGNSGGGVYDMKARLVGISTLKAVCDSPNENPTLSVYADSISFAIPVIKVKEYVDKWTAANLLSEPIAMTKV